MRGPKTAVVLVLTVSAGYLPTIPRIPRSNPYTTPAVGPNSTGPFRGAEPGTISRRGRGSVR